MKKAIVFAMLLIWVTPSFSQQTKTSQVLTKQDYLQKSKKQKTIGLILLSGGVAFGVTSTIVALNKTDEGFLYFMPLLVFG